MTEVVFKMIAFGLEHIVVFVFDFPARATIARYGDEGGWGNLEICDKGIFINLFTCIFTSDRPFAPIDLHGILVSAQRQSVGVTIGMDFALASIPIPLLVSSQNTWSG